MVPPLYCRWRDCGKPHYRVAGMMPSYCPECGKRAMWTTNLSLAGQLTDPADGIPTHPWELSFMDKRFLRSLRIEWREDADA